MKRQKRKPDPSPELLGRSSPMKTLPKTEETAIIQPITLDQETFHLTNNEKYFPELVWELITKKLKTPKDIENCSNSGHFFNKLLKKKRETSVVLPKVFEILAEKYAKSKDNSYKETNLQSIPWNRRIVLPISRMTGIWKCKLVCKSWSKAIDDIFQQDDVGFCSFDTSRLIPVTSAFKNCHLLKYTNYRFTVGTAEDFTTRFNSTHYNMSTNRVTKNPFIGRIIEFHIMTPVTEDFMVIYQNEMSEILEKWGREIWYCRIQHFAFSNQDDEVMFYRLFRESLICMPNLKSLNVFCNVNRNKFVQTDLLREIREHPLPTLPKLMYLKAFNFRGPFYDHFISVNNIPEGKINLDNHSSHFC